MKLELKNLKEGQHVWICDYRYNDVSKKPIRNVKPIKAVVVLNEDLPKNKRVYYSSIHFRTLNKDGKPSKKIIAPFDNTGFRSYTGVCLNMFDDKEECIECYKEQYEKIIKDVMTAKEDCIKRFDLIVQEINNDKDEK